MMRYTLTLVCLAAMTAAAQALSWGDLVINAPNSALCLFSSPEEEAANCIATTAETCEPMPIGELNDVVVSIVNQTNYFQERLRWPDTALVPDVIQASQTGLLPAISMMPSSILVGGAQNEQMWSEICQYREPACPVSSGLNSDDPQFIREVLGGMIDNVNNGETFTQVGRIDLVNEVCHPTACDENRANPPGVVRVTDFSECAIADFENPARGGAVVILIDDVGNQYINVLRNAATPPPTEAVLPPGYTLVELQLEVGQTLRFIPITYNTGCVENLRDERDCYFRVLFDALGNIFRRFYDVGVEPTGGVPSGPFSASVYPPIFPPPELNASPRCKALCDAELPVDPKVDTHFPIDTSCTDLDDCRHPGFCEPTPTDPLVAEINYANNCTQWVEPVADVNPESQPFPDKLYANLTVAGQTGLEPDGSSWRLVPTTVRGQIFSGTCYSASPGCPLGVMENVALHATVEYGDVESPWIPGLVTCIEETTCAPSCPPVLTAIPQGTVVLNKVSKCQQLSFTYPLPNGLTELTIVTDTTGNKYVQQTFSLPYSRPDLSNFPDGFQLEFIDVGPDFPGFHIQPISAEVDQCTTNAMRDGCRYIVMADYAENAYIRFKWSGHEPTHDLLVGVPPYLENGFRKQSAFCRAKCAEAEECIGVWERGCKSDNDCCGDLACEGWPWWGTDHEGKPLAHCRPRPEGEADDGNGEEPGECIGTWERGCRSDSDCCDDLACEGWPWWGTDHEGNPLAHCRPRGADQGDEDGEEPDECIALWERGCTESEDCCDDLVCEGYPDWGFDAEGAPLAHCRPEGQEGRRRLRGA